MRWFSLLVLALGLVNSSRAQAPAPNCISVGTRLNQFGCKTVIITSAQLLNADSNGSPITIVPAPGPGNVIFPFAVRAKLTFVSQAYCSSFTQGPYLWWQNNSNGIGALVYPNIPADVNNFSLNLIVFNTSTSAMFNAGLSTNFVSGFDPTFYTNQPIVLQVGTTTETLNCGNIQSISVTTSGTGYYAGDYLQTASPTYGNTVNNSLLQVTTVNGSNGITGASVLSSGNSYAGVANVTTLLGNLTASTLNSGGTGYVIGDTGTISGDGDGSATYTVNTVNNITGAVLTYTIDPTSGNSYTPQSNVATMTGGGQPGVGTGFTVNVLSGGGSGGVFNFSVLHGDGTLTLTLWYIVAPA